MACLVPPVGDAFDAATHLSMTVAGAESNVAMYLADDGVPVQWVSRVGDDPFGRRILRTVAACGVDVSGVEIDRHRPTGLLIKEPRVSATRVHYYRTNSAAASMTDAVILHERVRSAPLLHLTGITPALSPSCAHLVRTALAPGEHRARVVSFDVNYRPALWRDPPGMTLLRLANQADIVFVGLDEADNLWGPCPDAETVRALIPDPQVLVVKDGPRAATAFTGSTATCVPALRVPVVEVVGAGDAFAAGFLAGVLRGESTETALRRGHITAASALQVTGDHGPLLPVATFQRLLTASDQDWARPIPDLPAALPDARLTSADDHCRTEVSAP